MRIRPGLHRGYRVIVNESVNIVNILNPFTYSVGRFHKKISH